MESRQRTDEDYLLKNHISSSQGIKSKLFCFFSFYHLFPFRTLVWNITVNVVNLAVFLNGLSGIIHCTCHEEQDDKVKLMMVQWQHVN